MGNLAKQLGLWCLGSLLIGALACAQGKPLGVDAGLGSAPGNEPELVDASPAPSCACSAGECCDGCNVMPDTALCGSEALDVEFDCDGVTCGADARLREQYQYCNGASTDCGQGNLVWHDWMVLEDCAADALCETDGLSASCSTCQDGCADGSCVCAQGGNVAPSAVATINRGSSAPATYGAQIMNDGANESSCGFSWFFDQAPDVGWMALEWSVPQDLWGFSVDTVSSVSAPCAYTEGRTLAAGTVQWWDGAVWITDGTVSGQSGDWTYTFSSPITTTRVRIYGAYGSPTGNPVVFEWQAFACSGS